MWLSLAERLVWDQDVAGSNPVIRTIGWAEISINTGLLALVVAIISKLSSLSSHSIKWASKGFRHGFERIKPRRYATALWGKQK